MWECRQADGRDSRNLPGDLIGLYRNGRRFFHVIPVSMLGNSFDKFLWVSIDTNGLVVLKVLNIGFIQQVFPFIVGGNGLAMFQGFVDEL